MSSLFPATTFSISINRPWREAYDAIWRPEFFPRWASGLARSDLRRDGDRWVAQGPEGEVRIRFSDRNDHGVMDHVVDVGGGVDVHIPLRVIANGDGAEILITLFRQPDMDDEKFAADAAMMKRDLRTLKTLLEA